MFQWLADLIIRFAQWLFDLFLYIPRYLWSIIVDFVLSMFDFVISLMPDLSGLYMIDSLQSSGIGYYLCLLDFWIGLSIVVSSYIVRFLIRRIPFIG
jgi:hypothetical protein